MALSTSPPSAEDPEMEQYALQRVGFLLGQYAKARPHEPVIYTAGIAAILAEYPRSVIEYVTDPRTGLASRIKWIPEPAEVREACEERMAPTRMHEARKIREREYRRSLPPPIDRSNRPTAEAVKAHLAAHGIHIGERGRVVAVETPAMVRARYGLSQADWDALPNAPPRRESVR